MRVFTSADDILGAAGETLGTTDWLTITQERVNQFAEATGDHQWIHVDVERAKAESPFGGPIAHGYLTLSLVPMLAWQLYSIENAKLGINYGSNKVRFPAPVPVGSEVSLTAVLTSAQATKDGMVEMVVTQTLTVRDAPKPSLVAETITRVAF
ncbi:enoyl-CoA hydratase [Williamsia sp. Leaf354]|jgi:acyl dehydratase|uniref:MaoC family dehydratase n=1 Tax=Williamsia herbipolensis TaxID=1603258 RepID=A0AAU4K5M4_9NOCA|nr:MULTISPECIES: MaoC family dehydratase [Williamsia]KQR98147.1 enoyl-CoA hydratase [Williamsia sp. Leaf354]MCX6469895.1 MaoC family dehydratase [Mycobacteriales bacterium]